VALLLDTTPVQEEAFKSSFRARRLLRFPLLGSAFLAVLAVLVELADSTTLATRLGVESWVVHLVASAVLVAAVAVWYLAWRCPACRRFLRTEISPSYCRSCGCPFD
jgi:hypothetical protein